MVYAQSLISFNRLPLARIVEGRQYYVIAVIYDDAGNISSVIVKDELNNDFKLTKGEFAMPPLF